MSKPISLNKKKASLAEEDHAADQATNYLASSSPKAGEEPVFVRLDEKGPLSEADAYEAFGVISPSASAGSYKKAFSFLGCSKVVMFESSSSAGDWTFLVKRRGVWFCATQENGYPAHPGFRYFISEEDVFLDPNAMDMYEDIKSTLREEDPDYLEGLED